VLVLVLVLVLVWLRLLILCIVAGDANNPGVISDVFVRVGGAGDAASKKAETVLLVQMDHVIIDNVWLWRADHDDLGPVMAGRHPSKHGLVVDADNVTAYGVFTEHFLEDNTVWKGEVNCRESLPKKGLALILRVATIVRVAGSTSTRTSSHTTAPWPTSAREETWAPPQFCTAMLPFIRILYIKKKERAKRNDRTALV
jgi:hypothetical protein